MIVIIPVMLVMPAMLMLIPPFIVVLPAPFSCFMELVPPVVRLAAVVTVLFNRAVELVIGVNQLSLAIVACVCSRRSCEQHSARQHHRPASKSDQARFPSTCHHGSHSPPQVSLEAGPSLHHAGFPVFAWFYLIFFKHRAGSKVLRKETGLRQLSTPAKTGPHPCGISPCPRVRDQTLHPRCPQIAKVCIRPR